MLSLVLGSCRSLDLLFFRCLVLVSFPSSLFLHLSSSSQVAAPFLAGTEGAGGTRAGEALALAVTGVEGMAEGWGACRGGTGGGRVAGMGGVVAIRQCGCTRRKHCTSDRAKLVTGTHCHWHSLPLPLTVTGTHCHCHSLPLSLTATVTHCHCHSLSLSLTATVTLTLTVGMYFTMPLT